MKQKEIKKLLEEASGPQCTKRRRDKIQAMFMNATAFRLKDCTYENIESVAGIEFAMCLIYKEALSNNPEVLPSFFPLFAIACGDRKNGEVAADVDWSLME